MNCPTCGHPGYTAHEAYTAASVQLAEHLMTRSRRLIYDPLVERAKAVVVRRFRDQADLVGMHGHMAPRPVSFDGLAKVLGDAYWTGSDHSSGMLSVHNDGLDAVFEAKRKHPPIVLPGLRRDDAEIADELDATSRAAIDLIVADGIREGLSQIEIVARIVAQFKEWEGSRADTIAENEVSISYHQGMADVASGLAEQGVVVEKRWSDQPDACPICVENASLGWVPIDQQFPSGQSEAPGHIWCRCSMEYREQ